MDMFKEMKIPATVYVKVMSQESKLSRADLAKAILHLENKFNENAGVDIGNGIHAHGRIHLPLAVKPHHRK